VHPEFLTYVDHGDTALFTCTAYGTPLPSITWSNLAAPNSSYNNESEFRIYQNLLRLNGVAFITSILEACRVNSSSHSCIASNVAGNDSYLFEVPEPIEGGFQLSSTMLCYIYAF